MTYRYKGELRQPTPTEIKDARERVQLSQQGAAELIDHMGNFVMYSHVSVLEEL